MRAAAGAALLALAIAGCAAKTKTTVPAASVARPANVSYGTILVERPVAVGAGSNGADAPAGAAVGGTAGGFAGGDVRSNILAAIGGAATGEMTSDSATEFIIREDDGGTISVVQGNELKLQPGERVMIIHGAETRLAPEARAEPRRVAGAS